MTTLNCTKTIGFFSILLVALIASTASRASDKSAMAYYNQHSTPQLDIAAVDQMLSQRSAVNSFNTFVPVYPQPQQHYIQAPVQPQYMPQQQVYYQQPYAIR